MKKPKDRLRLWNIPNNSKMRLETDRGMENFIFRHIDGMYSYITGADDRYINLRADTKVKKVGDHYEISK